MNVELKRFQYQSICSYLPVQLLYFEQEENGGLGLALQVLAHKCDVHLFMLRSF